MKERDVKAAIVVGQQYWR